MAVCSYITELVMAIVLVPLSLHGCHMEPHISWLLSKTSVDTTLIWVHCEPMQEILMGTLSEIYYCN